MAPHGFRHLKSFWHRGQRPSGKVGDSEHHDSASRPQTESMGQNTILASESTNIRRGVGLSVVGSEALPDHSESHKDGKLTYLQREELSMPDLSKSEKLWRNAYAALKREEPSLVQDFEDALGFDTISTRSTKRLGDILRQRVLAQDAKQLVITIMGKPVKVREIGEKIIAFVESTQDLVSTATSNEPHAALAWATVSLILPILLNQKKQVESMMEGLHDITALLRRYNIRDSLYLGDQAGSRSGSCSEYEEAVTELYKAILLYQLRFYHHLERHPVTRSVRNMGRLDDWESWKKDIKEADAECQNFENIFDKVAERDSWIRQDAVMKKQSWIQAQILKTINDASDERRAIYADRREERLLQTLSSRYEEQENINPKRVDGTCEWFLQSAEFREWNNANQSCLLWLSAGPGCGKSVLSRCLVDEDIINGSLSTTIVCYFFFKDGQKGQVTAANAMTAITHQVLSRYSDAALMAHSLERFRKHGEKLAEMFSELWPNLLQSAKDPIPGEIVCILDALDECQPDERQQLLNALIEFYSQLEFESNANIRLKFLITSRQDLSIENRLAKLNKSVSLVHINADREFNSISQDIDRFIEDQIPLVAHRLDEASQARIIAYLKGMEHRTYLWLHLTFKEIEESAVAGTTEKQLRKFISTLPKSVDEAYENILNKSKEPEIARKFLQCILVARETLTVTDLNVAFGAWHDCTSYSTLDLEPGDSFSSTLKQICGHFVIVHKHRVYLIHQTAREFLIGLENSQPGSAPSKAWQHSILVGEAEATLAHTCMSVMCFEDFLEKPPYSVVAWPRDMYEIETVHRMWFDAHPFFAYCAKFWTSHYHSSAEMARPGMLERIRQLCNPGSTHLLNWVRLREELTDVETFSSLLQISSLLGIDFLVIESLNEISDNEAQKAACDNALSLAARGGRRDTMALLLEKGANVNGSDGGRVPPLHQAVISDNAEAVEFLLGHGANTEALNDEGFSVLCLACSGWDSKTVELLLAHNADVNAVSSDLGSPLFVAACEDDEDISRLLFEKGARFRKDDWADSKGWNNHGRVMPIHELEIIYELVKDQGPEDYIRILVEKLSFVNRLNDWKRWDKSDRSLRRSWTGGSFGAGQYLLKAV